MSQSALLALEDGSLFEGTAIGIPGKTTGEVVFNTAMTGYQEILTDPSYARQIVTLTYPHIGNTGTNDEDMEAGKVHAAGLVIRDLPLLQSSWRAQMSLPEFLEKNKVVAIANIDTRRLTRLLREKGAQRGCIVAAARGERIRKREVLEAAGAVKSLAGMDLAKVVTTRTSYEWAEGVWKLGHGYQQPGDLKFHVVAYDFGVKKNILRMLSERGCKLTVVPATTTASEVLALKPDGIFLSNGPGDPEPCDYAIEAISQLITSKIPVFGICLGHQLLALASGAKTMKMKFGHHGANHPVQDLKTKTVMISSQNHGFAIDENSIPANLEITHRSLFDGTVQGIRHREFPAYSFQGHPEASPGPHDVAPVFDEFITLMQNT